MKKFIIKYLKSIHYLVSEYLLKRKYPNKVKMYKIYINEFKNTIKNFEKSNEIIKIYSPRRRLFNFKFLRLDTDSFVILFYKNQYIYINSTLYFQL